MAADPPSQAVSTNISNLEQAVVAAQRAKEKADVCKVAKKLNRDKAFINQFINNDDLYRKLEEYSLIYVLR